MFIQKKVQRSRSVVNSKLNNKLNSFSIKAKFERYHLTRGKIENKKVAFTLAEVLITLGIIGVVAAITMPTLIHNYQKQVTVNKLKKAYSVVNQAINLSIADNGDYSNWNKTSEIGNNEFFNEYWLPYFQGITICTRSNKCGYGTKAILPSTFTLLNGSSSGFGPTREPLNITAISDGRSTIMLPDGSVIIYVTNFGDIGSQIDKNYILIDINGGNSPNVYGKDVFLFYRTENGGIQPRCKGLATEKIDSDCSKNGTGECCAQKIINDGWKMTYL